MITEKFVLVAGTLLILLANDRHTFAATYALGPVALNLDQGYENGEHAIYFKCMFRVYDGFTYNIIWSVNVELFKDLGNLTSAEADSNSISSFQLYDGYESTAYAPQIYCRVSVFDSVGTVLLDRSSSSHLVPIMPSTSDVSIIRGQDAQFTVRLNLPFGCSSDTDICKLQYILYDPDDSHNCTDSSIAVKGTAEVIGATMATIGHWSTVNTTTAVTISAIHNNRYRLRNSFLLQLKTNVTGNAFRRWNNRLITNIQVTVQDSIPWKGSYCYSHVDPHMKTADAKGRRSTGYYENQNVEEFVMLRHTTLPIEIQTMTKPCNRDLATCSCSVTMRAGSDVFTINHCHGHVTGFLTADEEILQVYQMSPQTYQIYFPTGMTVGVYIMPNFEYTMNIDIYLSPSEYNQVEGLCGNFNGNLSDDFQIRGTSQYLNDTWWPDEFSMSWGLVATNREDESLLSSTKIRNLERWPIKTSNVCICPAEKVYTAKGDHMKCSAGDIKMNKAVVYNRGHVLQVTSGKKQDDVVYVLDTHQRLAEMKQHWLKTSFGKKRQKRQNGGAIPKENATQLCIDEFSKCPAYTLKDQTTILDVNATIEECSLDVMLDGEVNWVPPHCDAYTDTVKTEIDRNQDFADANTNLVQMIGDISCPGDCNGHGNCTKGICSCDPGYGTPLCLLNLRDPVVIEEVSGGGICDRRTGNTCTAILVVANGFVETARCRANISVAGRDGVFNYKNTLETQCVYVNYNEVYAPIQESRRRRAADSGAIEIAQRIGVSVSNDGVTFSETKYVIVLDSSCQENTTDSNGDQAVLLKAGFCVISGVCYAAGSSNSVDICYTCQPTVDPYIWTNNTCDEPGTSDSDHDKTLGIVVGTFGAFLVAVVVGLLVKCYLKRKA